MTEYFFVIDKEGKQLSPTKANRGWYLIRKGKAVLENKYPLVIRLNRVIEEENIDKSEIICGIDDGSKRVGIGILQRGKFKNKAVLKGTIILREDVKHLMDVRRGYRRYHRYHKRHREERIANRSSSRRKGRVLPSIKQKKDSIKRVVRCSVNNRIKF